MRNQFKKSRTEHSVLPSTIPQITKPHEYQIPYFNTPKQHRKRAQIIHSQANRIRVAFPFEEFCEAVVWFRDAAKFCPIGVANVVEFKSFIKFCWKLGTVQFVVFSYFFHGGPIAVFLSDNQFEQWIHKDPFVQGFGVQLDDDVSTVTCSCCFQLSNTYIVSL